MWPCTGDMTSFRSSAMKKRPLALIHLRIHPELQPCRMASGLEHEKLLWIETRFERGPHTA